MLMYQARLLKAVVAGWQRVCQEVIFGDSVSSEEEEVGLDPRYDWVEAPFEPHQEGLPAVVGHDPVLLWKLWGEEDDDMTDDID